MAFGLKVIPKVDGLDKLKAYIKYVEKFSTMKTDAKFQKFIQNKFLETVRKITIQRSSNGELSTMYNENHKIRETNGGFILYNDTIVETESEGYGGKFSIALAFEYGTGLVGEENPKVGAWQYNVNGHEKGWTFYENGTFHFTRGFEGYEIYRYTLEEIKANLRKWVLEYNPKDGGVSQ